MKPRIKIPKLEFYITNVCNLTCDHCNRFNNLNFKGWQAWDDYAEIYSAWAELIDIEHIVILGGEPLLNPTIIDWVRGLSKIWPGYHQILTNGTRLNNVKGLYDAICQNKTWMGISIHNFDEIETLFNEVEKFLKSPITKSTGKEGNKYGADFSFKDKNNVEIPMWIQNEFTKSALIHQPDGKITLHSSDPSTAHDHCAIAKAKSYHFIRGKLYKCGPVALFPELDSQFGLDLTQEDRDLIHQYQPLTIDNFDEYHSDFFKNLDNPIPQCKFCPGKNDFSKIFPLIKIKA